MKLKSIALAAGFAIVAVAGNIEASASPLIFDFENAVPAGAFYYAPGQTQFSSDHTSSASFSGVTFSGMSGIQNGPSGWNFPPSPNPTSTAFIQSYQNQPVGSISFDVSSLVVGKTYGVSFLDIKRGYSSGAGGPLSFTVGYNGASKTFTPTNVSTWSTGTFDFTYAAGMNSLLFAGVPPNDNGDHSVGLDVVRIAAIPEPSTWAMMVMGLLGVGFMAYRRKPGARLRLA